MTTLELLQMENEHKADTFYEKGEDVITNNKIDNKEGETKL